MTDTLEHYKVQARAAMFDELVKALDAMSETHCMHGPCRVDNCSECRRACSKADAVLARAATLK